jgi:hypothetical protein
MLTLAACANREIAEARGHFERACHNLAGSRSVNGLTELLSVDLIDALVHVREGNNDSAHHLATHVLADIGAQLPEDCWAWRYAKVVADAIIRLATGRIVSSGVDTVDESLVVAAGSRCIAPGMEPLLRLFFRALDVESAGALLLLSFERFTCRLPESLQAFNIELDRRLDRLEADSELSS